MWELLFEKHLVFLVVFARMSGMILFNPILSRKSVSAFIKVGLAFFCSLILTAVLEPNLDFGENQIVFVLICFKELFIGFLCGFIIQLFLSAVLMAGELVDLQLGIGMAKIYDPQSNVSMPISGSLFHLLFITAFFVSNGHLTLMRIIFYSFEFLPVGTALFNPQAWQHLVLLFSQMLLLGLKIALPIIAIEIVTEMGLGILMRTVPQINIFMVGLPLKLLVGLGMLFLVLPGIFELFDLMLEGMYQEIAGGLEYLSS